MLTIADEGGRGVSQKMTIADRGGRGVYELLFLADVICEQPLTRFAVWVPILAAKGPHWIPISLVTINFGHSACRKLRQDTVG